MVNGQTDMRSPSLGILSSVRVLDLSRALSGPFCTRLMADHGAEVIKVEPPGGDMSRGLEYLTPEGRSGYFIQQNCGKQSVSLDLRIPGALRFLQELVEISDVVLENFRPGVMAKLGLGYSELLKINPSIVMCSLSGYGEGSPHAHRVAGDQAIQASSGMMWMTGHPDGPPLLAGSAICDFSAGLHAFGGVCAALFDRAVTGRGHRIDISMFDCAFWQHDIAIQQYLLSKGAIKPRRYGNRRSATVPANAYQGRDGYVTIVAATDSGFANLARAMGMPELADDPRFSTRKARLGHADELDAEIEKWLGGLDSVDTAVSILADRAKVLCAKVMTIEQVVEDPQVKARNLLPSVEDPVLGPIRVVNSPIRFSSTPSGPRGPAPLMGQHYLEVFHELLGHPSEEVLDLLGSGVLDAEERAIANQVGGSPAAGAAGHPLE